MSNTPTITSVVVVMMRKFNFKLMIIAWNIDVNPNITGNVPIPNRSMNVNPSVMPGRAMQ